MLEVKYCEWLISKEFKQNVLVPLKIYRLKISLNQNVMKQNTPQR